MLPSIRQALRILPKDPGFTAVAISSLEIGIGATAAMFSFADSMLLRPLRIREPDRVVTINTAVSEPFGKNTAISYPDYLDLRDRNRTFEGLAAASYAFFGFSAHPGNLPHMKWGLYVSGDFFRVLGVEPARPARCSTPARSGYAGLRRPDHARSLHPTRGKVVRHYCADGRWYGLHGDVSGRRRTGGYSVSRRTREIGIRMALGANRSAVVRMVLRQGLRLGVAGVAVGLVVALYACRAVSAALSFFAVDYVDPLVYLAIPSILLLMTVLAAWSPARQAARVDPLIALRDE